MLFLSRGQEARTRSGLCDELIVQKRVIPACGSGGDFHPVFKKLTLRGGIVKERILNVVEIRGERLDNGLAVFQREDLRARRGV